MIAWCDEVPHTREAMGVWRAEGVLAIREHWLGGHVDFGVLRSARESAPFKRKRLGPWQAKPMTDEVRLELAHLHISMQSMFTELYAPLGPPAYSQFTFRPTVTRGPLHRDKEKGAVITAFLNLDTEDRVWMLAGEEVRFPPGCMWIFQAEKIEHQVLSGNCCAQLNWHLMKEIE